MSTGTHAAHVLNTGRLKQVPDRLGRPVTEYLPQKATSDHAENGNRRNVAKAKAARASRKANRPR